MKYTRASLILLFGLSLVSLSIAQSEYGCKLINSNCNGNGLCEFNGICTCKPGYVGDLCETKFSKKFVNQGRGKSFITFWVLFWILLNLLLPLLICIIIAYLKEKNCQALKDLKEMCCDSICCCLSKDASNDTSKRRFGGAEIAMNEYQGKSLLDNEAKPEELEKAEQENKDAEEESVQKKPENKKLENLVSAQDKLGKARQKVKNEVLEGDRSKLPVRSIQQLIHNYIENVMPEESARLASSAGPASRQLKHCENLETIIEEGNAFVDTHSIPKQTHAINLEIAKAFSSQNAQESLSNSTQKSDSKQRLEKQIQELEKKLSSAKFKQNSKAKEDILLSIR